MKEITGAIKRSVLLVLLLSLAVVVFLVPVQVSAATCSTSGPTSGAYTVSLCITAPTAGAILTGAQSVTGTATVTGTNPGVQRMVFSLDNAYLITDYQSTYTFSLPTDRYVDGAHSIQASALMRDGFQTASASLSVTFSNGVTQPPVNTSTFNPASGTSPAAGSPFVVAAVGDGASGQTTETNVVNLVKNWNPNLFLYLGDTYEKGSPVEFFNWYRPAGYFGAFRTITNPTIGNHEYLYGSTAAGYFDYWNNVPNYYSFNAGGWHFVSLNSNGTYVPTNSSSAQYAWLQQDLTANTGVCTIVFYHHPAYSVGSEGSALGMRSIWSLLAQYHVPLVLNGHEHNYQRWVPMDGAGNPSSTGVTEIVAGTGGHGIQAFKTTDSRLAAGYASTSNSYGALRLSLSASSAAFAFINTAGTTLDSGTIPCNGSSVPPSTPTNTPTPTSTPVSAPTNTPTSTPVGAPTNTPTNTPTPSSGTGTTTTVVAAADTYVDSSNPTVNYGTSTQFRVDASPTVNSFLRFNVQNLPGTVTQATLRIYANSSLSAGFNVDAVADNTWGETTMTYNTAPAIGSLIRSSGAATSGAWLSIDVTPYITGNGTFSMALVGTSTTALSLGSRESTNKPQLVILTNP